MKSVSGIITHLTLRMLNTIYFVKMDIGCACDLCLITHTAIEDNQRVTSGKIGSFYLCGLSEFTRQKFRLWQIQNGPFNVIVWPI